MFRRPAIIALALVCASIPALHRPADASDVAAQAPLAAETTRYVQQARQQLPVPAAAGAPCTDTALAGVPPAAGPIGIPGAHAAFYARSGYPVLCPGDSAKVTIAFLNSGSLGWYGNASLGTWGPEPGQDKSSALGGDGSSGTLATGWARSNRPAVQPASYVAPGEVAWFQFSVQAPAMPGLYRVALRPLLEGQEWLEDPDLTLTVLVKSDDAHVPQLPVAVTPPPAAEVPRTYQPATLSDGSRAMRVPSLMYHYVSWLPVTDPNMALRKDLTVSPTDFEQMLQYLRDNGYHTVSTRDLWWSLDQTAGMPQRPIMLTFDDGYADAYSVVLPLLQKYGFTGVFFVTVNLVGRPGYITRDQVRALADAGMDVESHAMDHVSMMVRNLADQQYQMCRARDFLSAWTGTDVRHFAYPSGDYNDVSFTALQRCGYLSAYKKSGGSIQSTNGWFVLQRARVRGQAGLAAMLQALQQ